MTWKPCPAPKPGDTIRWNEPLWAAHTKKRGMPDQIGEQQLTAEVLQIEDTLQLKVTEVEILAIDDGAQPPEGVKVGDVVRRKPSSIARGDCHKLH